MAKAPKKSAKKKSAKTAKPASAAKSGKKKKKFLGSIVKVAGLDHSVTVADGGQTYMLASMTPIGPFPYSSLC